MSEAIQYIKVPKGLENVIVDKTAISVSDPEGYLIYRGYSIQDVAENSFFEEIAYLILFGKVPNEEELSDFISKLKREREVPFEIYEIFEKLKGKYLVPIDLQKIGVSLLAAYDETWYAQTKEELYLKAIRIISKLATLTANAYRIVYKNLKPIEPRYDLNHSENFLYMLNGKEPDPFYSKILDVTLILYMDHDFNASTFTARVTASTLTDIYSSIASALAALKGPLHGGANERATEMLLKIKDEKEAEEYILSSLRKKEKIMGFGHRVYKKVDPRVPIAKKLFLKLLKRKPELENMYRIMLKFEEVMWRERRIPPNIDFWIGPLYYGIELDIPLYTPLFALGRVVGWIAHYIEQLQDNKIMRPKAEYVGPLNLKFPYQRKLLDKI
jgi:citrate synthase